MKRVNKKSFPFLLLSVIQVGLLFYTFYKQKDRKHLFVLLLSNIGLAYIFEFIILNLFQSYEYKPKVFKKKYLDNIFGAFLSQSIFLPFSSVFITGNGFGWGIKILFSLFYAIIERMFINWGVFSNYWWRTVYTLLIIPFYFKLSDFWYSNVLKGKKWILNTSFFLMTWVSGIGIIHILAVNRTLRFGIGKYFTWRKHFIFSTIYWFFQSLLLTWSIKNNSKWLGIVRSFCLEKLFHFVMVKNHLLKVKANNMLIFNGFYYMMIYLSAKFKEIIFQDELSKIKG